MLASVLELAVAFREALAEFNAGLLSGAECARLAEELAAVENACAAARLFASVRAVDCGAHHQRGFRDGAGWVARHTGATVAQARHTLETASGLADCPDTKAALVAGEVSVAQAAEITRAEAETRGAETGLLERARRSNLTDVRDHARQWRQSHTPVEDLHRRQHEARCLRHWRDRLGMVCFTGGLRPETGLPLVRRVEADAQRARRAARQAGATERFEAHAADALAALATGGGRPARRGTRRSWSSCATSSPGDAAIPIPAKCATSSTAGPFLSPSPKSSPTTHS